MSEAELPAPRREGLGTTIVGMGLLVAFCGFLWTIFFLLPVRNLLRMRVWQPTTCQILSSRVTENHRSSTDGDTYGVAITYQWTRSGTTYEGDRYDPYGWESNGRAEARALVASLPPMREVGCFVDPNDPRQAVIDRVVHGTQIFPWVMSWALMIFAGFAVRLCVRYYRR
jgi:hypothetical protein